MARLTPREQQVVRLMAEGIPQARIADVLCVSKRTVYAHVHNVKQKTGIRSSWDLALRARREADDGDN